MNPVTGKHWHAPDFIRQNISPTAARRAFVPESQRHRQCVQHTGFARTVVTYQQRELPMEF